ncbi:WAT1-related protein [Artemisia annua]|uniref:WAT1-related protein n=1 Tax=Artemisia annua TaxID=35608 RepID=A0A2U1N3P1_ARTAN|nr:WAT1-related protein [Artemisia annua]
MALVKPAMNNGMSQLVYVVYNYLLGTIVLFQFFAIHNHRMEKLDLKSSSSQVKSLGTSTTIAISGAFLLTLYKGPQIFQNISNESSDVILLSPTVILETWRTYSCSHWHSFFHVERSSVFGSAFRNRALTWCLHRKGPVHVALFKPISIVVAVVTGILFLGDTLYLGSVIGAVIIAIDLFGGVGSSQRKEQLSYGLHG